MSKEALFVVSLATEEFIKRLSHGAQYRAAMERRTSLNYNDMANCTHFRREFTFLQDVIPQPISLAVALQRRATKDDDILDEEPPMASLASSIIPMSAPISYTGSGTISIPPMYHQNYGQAESAALPSAMSLSTRSSSGGQVKPKIPHLSTNGSEKERMNGKSEAAKLRKRDSRGRWSTAGEEGEADGTPPESISGMGNRRSRTATAPSSVSHERSSRRVHGSASASVSRTSSTQLDAFTHEPHWTVLQQQDSSAEPPESYERGTPPSAPIGISLSAGLGLGRVRHSPLGEGSWGGYTTGPASGFLGGQGRTIYSTQRERRPSNAGSQR
ncbi:hypothetical protein NEOLEDRAFT_967799 [Neolentinus lepideus HHB14362 ss-1]|uniref:Transcription factor CBF/NF-Y/archaeal histone domain-containing protein n=1 Tax=Neolentinus lepideus HHB14362 ss-1 TaxID=1314782 RepID=A0A165ND05_9AGAM|nr:hypothetical protein NEOLEDRAFT_967799 [Neolentinus lepideus HHB14362 ss-1]